jgi:hypothetical protein
MRQLITVLAVMTTALMLGAGVAFAQTIIGDVGDNRLVGTPQADFINGKEGDDTLYPGLFMSHPAESAPFGETAINVPNSRLM